MAEPITGSIAIRVLMEEAATSGATKVVGAALPPAPLGPASQPRGPTGRFLSPQYNTGAYKIGGPVAQSPYDLSGAQAYAQGFGGSQQLNPQDKVEGMSSGKANNKYLKLIAGITGIYGMVQLVKQSKILSASIGAFLQIVGAIFDVLLAPLLPLLIPMLKSLAALVPAIMKLVQGDIWGAIKELARAMWESAKEEALLVWRSIKDLAEVFWNNIRGFAEGSWNLIRGFVEGVWSRIGSFVEGIWSDTGETIERIWDGIRGYAEGAWDLIRRTAEGTWNAIKNFAESIWNIVRSTAETVWNDIKSFAQTIWNSITGIAEKAWKEIVQFFKNILGSVLHPTNLLKKVVDPFGILPFGGDNNEPNKSSLRNTTYSTDNRKIDIHINGLGLTIDQVVDLINKIGEEQTNERRP